MEGIDRLHQIAEDVGRTVWLRDLGAALSDTADAIEGGMRDLIGYESDVLAWVEKNGGLDAVNERTMPDDMEWPRYADGSPVEIGDDVIGPDYGERIHVDEVIFHVNGFTLRSKGGDGKWYESDDRFERPAVLAADGEPLEVGQTVWTVDAGIKFEVHSIEGDTVWGSLDGDRADDGLDPKSLTHQRPVLDADGVPIKVGDKVWRVNGDGPFTATEYKKPWMRAKTKDGHETGFWPDDLTHTKPEPTDSLERIADEIDRLREEVALHLGDYLYDEDGNDSIQFSMELVAKRCRALAERERGE